MRERLVPLFSALVVLFLVQIHFAQSKVVQTVKEEDFLGSVENRKYSNGYFGMSFEIPESWHVIDQETSVATARVGTDVLKGKNERSNKALEDSVKREVILLHFAKKPIGSIDNANFMMTAMKQPSPHVTPSMVAEATKSVLANSPNLKVVADTRIETIAGKKFALVEYVLTASDQSVKIKYYATVIKGFAVAFSLSFADEQDIVPLGKVVESFRFVSK